jgi:hypothetical protein
MNRQDDFLNTAQVSFHFPVVLRLLLLRFVFQKAMHRESLKWNYAKVQNEKQRKVSCKIVYTQHDTYD